MGRLASVLLVATAVLILAGVAGASGPSRNGMIAFMAIRDGRAEIALVGPNGGDPRTVTASGLNAEPSWSPDGSRLAYVCGNFSLCQMNPDGSGQTSLTNTGSWSGTYVFDEYPSWSPDGKKLAFQSNRGNLGYGIWVVGSDGTDLRRLAGNPNGDGDYGPSWSPDGTRIAFVSDNEGSDEIYLMTSDGGLSARLTQTDDDEDSPAWSPDGTKIVYDRWRGDFSNLWVMNGDGSGQHALTRGTVDDFSPVWSPDGTKILFSSDRGGNIDLYAIDADGSGQPTRLTTGATVEMISSWQPVPATPSNQPLLPPATAPVAQGDALLIGEIFDRRSELAAVSQAIFEAQSRHDLVSARIAYKRLANESKQAAITLGREHPTSTKGKRIQRLVVKGFELRSVEGRERNLAAHAQQQRRRKAQRRHERLADKAARRARVLLHQVGDLID